ncbi:hypothetical protein [Caldinitratiruptor microaerophilus]|uniref:Uncharacterized protein n=1 Tax=Caldinitratiruptor microaerophilus TaxID=671077 RepID=A0AA35CKN4_9FIRM|nr:hypothetical protein [Caldinitratiruptor microaerophilus]BDG60279.1 hypothetical protein caldi_13690 [Caldinitratiruptor microaerophilus]
MRDDLEQLALAEGYDSPADAIQADVFEDGGQGVPVGGQNDGASLLAALSTIERHIHPLAPDQLAAVLFLRHFGPERLRAVADDYLALYNLQAGPDALLAALESAALIRAFKGYTTSVQAGGVSSPLRRLGIRR